MATNAATRRAIRQDRRAARRYDRAAARAIAALNEMASMEQEWHNDDAVTALEVAATIAADLADSAAGELIAGRPSPQPAWVAIVAEAAR